MSNPNSTTVRCAVVGLGHIGQRHARLIREHPGMEWVLGIEPDTQKATALSEQLGVSIVPELTEIDLAAWNLELICICTPNGLHTSQALWALQRGCHVVCEKPFGLDPEACREVIREAERQNRELFCVLQNRYSPPARLLKELVGGGHFGDLQRVEVSCVWNRDDRYYIPGSWRGTREVDGGPLFTQFSHFVDLLVWLVGPLACEAARFGNFTHRHNTEFEDTGDAWLTGDTCDSGLLANLTYTTAAWERNFESRITMMGSRGIVSAGGQYMERIDYAHLKDKVLPPLEATAPPNDYGAWQGSADNHAFVFQNVWNTLRGHARPDAMGTDALRTVELIDRIYAFRG